MSRLLSGLKYVFIAINFMMVITPPALAAKFKIMPSKEDVLVISMTGVIKQGDWGKFLDKVAHSKATVKVLRLNSIGGSVFQAAKIGKIVRGRSVRTVIPKGATCASACSLIFVAGWDDQFNAPYRQKHKNSRLGIHKPFPKDRKARKKQTAQDKHLALQSLKNYFREMNVDDWFYQKTISTPSKRIHFVTDKQLRKLGGFRIVGASARVKNWVNNNLNCSSVGHYRNGAKVTISYKPISGWQFKFHKFQLLQKSRAHNLPAEVYIDRDRIFNGSINVGVDSSVSILVGKNPIMERSLGKGRFKTLKSTKDIAAKIAQGRTLRIVIHESSDAYDMSGTGRAVRAIQNCIEEKSVSNILPESVDRVVADRIDEAFQIYLSKSNLSDFKAFAIYPETGSSDYAENEKTPRLAIGNSLKKCSQPNKPCRLYALGNTIVFNLEEKSVDEISSEYVKSVANNRIKSKLKSYFSGSGYYHFKALAINPIFGFSGDALVERKPSAAIKKAIKNCSQLGFPCKLYALGETIVSDKTEKEIDRISHEYGVKIIRKQIGLKLNQFQTDSKYGDFKAMAFDPSGQRSYRTWNYKWHPKSAINMALKGCERRGDKCELVAIGNTIVFDMSETRLSEVIETYYKNVVGPSGLPIPVQAYMNDNWHIDFKVYVVNPITGSRHPESGQRTYEIALEKAMRNCRKKNDSCKLYAVGKTIVMEKSDKEIEEIVRTYKSEVMHQRIGSAFEVYLSYDDSVKFKALAIGSNSGLYGLSNGQTSLNFAINRALEKCELHGSDCKLYALGNKRVSGMSQEQIRIISKKYEEVVAENILSTQTQ